MYNKRISVIVPIYNALNDVQKLLDSLVQNFNFKLGNVNLINDCSNRKTTSYLKKFVAKNKDFSLVENEENLGFVKTCNKGIYNSKEDIIVLLNSDTIIPKNFCERIIKCFEFDEKIGIASPISSYSGEFFIFKPEKYGVEKMNELLLANHQCTYPLIPSAEGFCFCIRKEVIEQQGVLDEIYGKGYHEEVDFAYRAITNGWKNVLIDNMYVYHRRQASFGAKTREKLIEQNNPVFIERWKGFREKYIEEHNWNNPISQIEKEMFPDGNPVQNEVERSRLNTRESIFSVKKSMNRRYKVITILGHQFKIKRR